MGDYTEHLISMAGGDGDDALDLDAIQARADRVAEWRKAFHAPQNSVDYSQRDVPALLALVREQQAQIGRALVLAKSSPNTFLGRDIRAALTATDKS